MLSKVLLVGLGGFFGAVVRFLVVHYLSPYMGSFPLGILVVNVVGSFLMGFLLFITANDQVIPDVYKGLIAVGFLGSLTTMSALAFDSYLFAEEGDFLMAVANMILNVVLCFSAVVLGKWMAGLLST